MSPPPVVKHALTPADDKQGKVVEVDDFGIADIPATMTAMGWTEGARFMHRWFTTKPYILDLDYKIGTLDDRELKAGQHVLEDSDIDALTKKSARFKTIIDDLVADFSGNHQESSTYIGMQNGIFDHLAPGLGVFLGRLERLGLLDTATGLFKAGNYDYSTLAAIELEHATQFNFKPVGATLWEKATDSLDDVYGAFGALAVKFAATSFRLFEHVGFQCIEINEVGMYIRDSYDFLGDTQLLGYWCKKGVLKPSLWDYVRRVGYIDSGGDRYFRITNKSFNDYRKKNGMGGDFIVYSKVKKVETFIQIHLSRTDIEEYSDRKKDSHW